MEPEFVERRRMRIRRKTMASGNDGARICRETTNANPPQSNGIEKRCMKFKLRASHQIACGGISGTLRPVTTGWVCSQSMWAEIVGSMPAVFHHLASSP